MKTLLVTIKPLTAFATPLHGDTLFGQLCWALRNRHGDGWLTERLQGYTRGTPFLVVSDCFPAGYWPRPHLPVGLFRQNPLNNQDRKAEKKKSWLPRDQWHLALPEWLAGCRSEKEIWPEQACIHRPQHHNAINRLTGTTGKDGFAPYQVDCIWWPSQARLEAWVLYDPERLPQSALVTALKDMGLSGFGKDASTGLGKFALEGVVEEPLPHQKRANTWLTLGFCVPQGCGFAGEKSCYPIFTRFGRHGDRAAITGQPFKSPVLMASAGALFSPQERDKEGEGMASRGFVGQGLGGDGKLSKTMPETVHQGYAPVVAIHVAWGEKGNG